MRQAIQSLFIIGVLLFTASCGGDSAAPKSVEQLDGEALLDNIEELEENLFQTMETPDDSLAGRLIDAYERFASLDKEHEMSAEFLFRAANVARSFDQFERALGHYQLILREHPDYENRIETEFLVAFMYDNDFDDKTRAEAEYTRIMETYPDHLFGKEAANRLQHLHLDDQELIELFEQRRKEEEMRIQD